MSVELPRYKVELAEVQGRALQSTRSRFPKVSVELRKVSIELRKVSIELRKVDTSTCWGPLSLRKKLSRDPELFGIEQKKLTGDAECVDIELAGGVSRPYPGAISCLEV